MAKPHALSIGLGFLRTLFLFVIAWCASTVPVVALTSEPTPNAVHVKYVKALNYDFFGSCSPYEQLRYGSSFDYVQGFQDPTTDYTFVPMEKLQIDGSWFVDNSKRKHLLRGVNTSRPEPDKLHLLQRWGQNVVRFAFYWSNYEKIDPSTDESYFDEGYLDEVETFIKEARSRNIYVIIDMHQWFFSPQFSFRWGIGFPQRYFSSYENSLSGYSQALRDFWENKAAAASARKGLLDMWKKVAQRFGNHPNVLAYDLYNEPNPLPFIFSGMTTVRFNERYLIPFFQELIDAVRLIDRATPLCFEPATSDQYLNTQEIDPATLNDPSKQLCYMPHHYTLHLEDHLPSTPIKLGPVDLGEFKPEDYRTQGYCGNKRDFERDIGESVVMRERFGLPVLIGEWAVLDGMQNAQKYIVDSLDVQDALQLGSQWWSFGSKGRDLDLLDRDGNPRGNTLNALLRPYPQVISGDNAVFSFSVKRRTFSLSYTAGTGATIVYIPSQLVYPQGYLVRFSSGETDITERRWSPKNNLMSITAKQGASIAFEVVPTHPFADEIKDPTYYASDIVRACAVGTPAGAASGLLCLGIFAVLLWSGRERKDEKKCHNILSRSHTRQQNRDTDDAEDHNNHNKKK